jgi:L-erythro-3,5-diaminohexanoate dehydrogenase
VTVEAVELGLADRLGVGRVLAPPGVLPQAAERLDAETGPGAGELAVDVELLNLDATSHHQLREACGGDAEAIGEAIAGIVRRRGKMHNPVTGSGGILAGRVAEIGERFPADGLRVGDRIASVASLSLTPLWLESVGPLAAASPQIPVRGRAILAAGLPWIGVPLDLELSVALTALDVYGAASHTRDLARRGAHVLILGAGRAGLLAAAAAEDAVGLAGRVTVADVSADALARARSAGLGAVGLRVDASDALAVERALAPLGRADLTVVVVDRPGCEMGAVLATQPDGAVLFFSMATSFAAAALGAEGARATPRLLIGNGYAADRGAYALDLLRARPPLRAALTEIATEDGR